MTQAEFLDRWRSERPIYEAWGSFVHDAIRRELAPVIAPAQLSYFIKVPPTPRIKEEETLLDKAFKRGKPYEDPYAGIEDKVGIRFVVLLTTDITKVCRVVEGLSAQWTHSKDRDYEAERLAKPLEFTYQSVHYVVRAARDIEHQGQTIPAGTPCEIQIRTLLQHAHSELTHDTIYKPKTTAQPEVRRAIAKSMALIEATDEFFTQAMDRLNSAIQPQSSILAELAMLYEREVGETAGSERSNQLVIDTFFSRLGSNATAEVAQFLVKSPFVVDRIRSRRGENLFYRQPVALLAYYLVETMPAQTKTDWPMETDDLAQVFSDMGKRFDN